MQSELSAIEAYSSGAVFPDHHERQLKNQWNLADKYDFKDNWDHVIGWLFGAAAYNTLGEEYEEELIYLADLAYYRKTIAMVRT